MQVIIVYYNVGNNYVNYNALQTYCLGAIHPLIRDLLSSNLF